MKEKKKWEKPELIVITRCAPEENVLLFCGPNGNGCNPGEDDPILNIS